MPHVAKIVITATVDADDLNIEFSVSHGIHGAEPSAIAKAVREVVHGIYIDLNRRCPLNVVTVEVTEAW